MSEIVTEVVSITTTGSAGSATGSGTAPGMNGILLSIFLDYHASAPATTDVTIAYQNKGGNILVASNSATDTLYFPVKQNCDNTGAAVTGVYAQFPLGDGLSISVAQCDALTAAVTAYIKYLKV